jgi:hypothetical protein
MAILIVTGLVLLLAVRRRALQLSLVEPRR